MKVKVITETRHTDGSIVINTGTHVMSYGKMGKPCRLYTGNRPFPFSANPKP